MISLEVPIRTQSTLNLREHWATRAKRVKKEREATWFSLRPSIQRLLLVVERGPVVVQLTRRAPRLLDDDNCQGALKGVRDEIARVLGMDDADPRLVWRYSQAKGHYAVLIAVSPRSNGHE